MSDLQEELRAAFREEYREHVDGIRTVLAAAEGAGGQDSGAGVEEAFRRAHSLKAAARVCDLEPLAVVGARLESLFSLMRREKMPWNAELIAVVRTAADLIESWAQAWESGQALPDTTPVVAVVEKLLAPGKQTAETAAPKAPALPAPTPKQTPSQPAGQLPQLEGLDAEVLAAFQVEHREHLEGIRALLAVIETTGGEPAQIDEAFRRAHSLKGAARIAGLRQAEAVAHRLETLFARAREGTLRLTPEMVQVIQRGLNYIEDSAVCLLQLRPIPDPADELTAIDAVLGEGRPARSDPEQSVAAPPTSHTAHRTPHAAFAEEAVRVSTEDLDRLLETAEQVLTEGLSQDQSVRELALLQEDTDALLREWETVGTALGAIQLLAGTPEQARANRLLHQIGEKVRGLARRVRQTHRQHRQSSWALRVLARQLRHDVRQARTVPAEGVFQGFRKMMRDLAQSVGKEVEFRVTGLEVKADRLVLQALKDPLMHVLRNAICHGIEPPEERIRRGKDAVGQVSLLLEVVGNRLHLVVEDDGWGIDPRTVAAEAVRRQILTETEVATTDPEEMIRLIFRPGFSTTRMVTDLSGRGMGLSVVQEAATRLQGEVQLAARTRKAERGMKGEDTAAIPSAEGTRVAIVVPLSVSAQRLLLVACRGQTLALPIHGVEGLHRVRPQEIETVTGQPVVLLGGKPVPVRKLADLLDLAGDEEAGRDFFPMVVVRAGSRRLAVIVESLLGERDALLKDLGPAGKGDRWAGGILLEDGSVCLVLNPASLFRGARPTTHTAAPAAEARPRRVEKKTPTILVVDDSLTTRTLEKSILEAHGYRVRLALDGLEALTQMRSDLPDLVITDVQMPRLDGFGLLEQMKKDPRLARLPVIVVTSLEKREDQERGLALGADAYIVKRKFDHEELLQTVRQIL